jgi:hypothetical protein
MAGTPRTTSRGPRPRSQRSAHGADPASAGGGQAPEGSDQGGAGAAAAELPPVRQAVTADTSGYTGPVAEATEWALKFAQANFLAVASVQKLTETMKRAVPEMERFTGALNAVKASPGAKPAAAGPATARTAPRLPKGR